MITVTELIGQVGRQVPQTLKACLTMKITNHVRYVAALPFQGISITEQISTEF